MILSCHELGWRVRNRAIVNDVSLSLRPGEKLGLIGPNGSGKTTLLMVLAGFTGPDYGSVKFGDEEVILKPPPLRGIGMVFQNYALFPHMNVVENVGYPQKLRGISKEDTRESVENALATVKLDGLGHRRIDELSGGQKQRVALARAIVFQPKILLMDEPLSALDKKLREEMQIELRQLHDSLNMTTVYVTHDQTEALTFADKVVVMYDGRVVQIGTPEELFQTPEHTFVGYFIGSPGMNVIPAEVNGATAHIEGTELRLKRGYGDLSGKVELGVRPEFARLSRTEGLPVTVRRVEDVGRHKLVRAEVFGHDINIIADEDDDVSADMTHVVFDTDFVNVYANDWRVPGGAA